MTTPDSMHDHRLKLPKLQTFATMEKRVKGGSSAQASAKATRDIFYRSLAVGETRQIDLKKILSYSLSPVSSSLSSGDTLSLCKTNKAALLKAVLTEAGPDCLVSSDLEGVHPCTSLIINAMAVLHCINASSLPETFGELAEKVHSAVMAAAQRWRAGSVHFVL